MQQKTSNYELKPIKRESITESIIKQIQILIQNESFSPGEKFPSERELAEKLCVSRPTVREAMKVLQSMGVVDVRSGSGTYLADNTSLLSDHLKVKAMLIRYSWLEMVEARRALESNLVELAAQRATEENKVALCEIVERMKQTRNDEDMFLETDYNFHYEISQASQNRFLSEMLDTTRGLLIEINHEIARIPMQIEESIKYHERILDAVLRGDSQKAKSEMLEHLQSVENAIHSLYR